jgi:hypothetical protein
LWLRAGFYVKSTQAWTVVDSLSRGAIRSPPSRNVWPPRARDAREMMSMAFMSSSRHLVARDRREIFI